MGAMSVGRIVQVHPLDAYRRGDEKSVFRFGGSVIVVFGEPDACRANKYIVGHTKEGIESETVDVRI
jgi:phosphatidylserine decarboxylase